MYQTAFASSFAVSHPSPSWQMWAQIPVTPTSPFSQDFSGPFPVRLHFLSLFPSSTLRRFAEFLSFILRNGDTRLPRCYSMLINKFLPTFREKVSFLSSRLSCSRSSKRRLMFTDRHDATSGVTPQILQDQEYSPQRHYTFLGVATKRLDAATVLIWRSFWDFKA